MADDQIREGEPDPRRVRETAGFCDADGVSIPDIRRRPNEIEIVRQFRLQTVALGALWILAFGVLPFLPAYVFATGGGPPQSEDLALLLVAFALVWITLGVLACMRYVWAVRVGLVLNYLTVMILIVGLFRGDTLAGCGFLSKGAFSALSILQAHRIIGWASKMRAAGIPLDRKLK